MHNRTHKLILLVDIRWGEYNHMPTALVIEDQKETAALMKSILATRQINVIVVDRATSGIEIMRDTPPDIVFMDLLLPEMDGFTAIEIIKSDDDLKNIPVIAITAASIANSLDRLNEAGADAFIAKPFQIPELLATVERLLP